MRALECRYRDPKDMYLSVLRVTTEETKGYWVLEMDRSFTDTSIPLQCCISVTLHTPYDNMSSSCKVFIITETFCTNLFIIHNKKGCYQ